ncbi:MAG: hypothetical protein Q9218_003988 [Villophora microphyllina]
MAEPKFKLALRRLQLYISYKPGRAPSTFRNLIHEQRNFHVRRFSQRPADHSDFVSIVDNPPQPVFRLGWKSELIARFEDRLIKPPLPLPPRIDPEAIKDFDYRKVYTEGRLKHEQEMLIGPRIHDGYDGYLVVTPLERAVGASTVLVNRGWIPKNKRAQVDRKEGLPEGQVVIEGLLREPWKKNMFTPENRPEKGQFYFPDVEQMAAFTGSEAVWIEETMTNITEGPDLLKAWDREAKGVPIGRPAEVNLRNNHTQYIFTWYALSAATAIMLWMVVKKPPSEIARRARQNKNW